MLVKTYHIGNAVVHINDEAYAQKTPEELEQVMRRLEQILGQLYACQCQLRHK